MPTWRNSRRAWLRAMWPQGRVGATPTFGTMHCSGEIPGRLAAQGQASGARPTRQGKPPHRVLTPL